jgi:hypothetical protein
MGTGGSFLGSKGPGREADHSLPSGVEVTNDWSYTSTPQYLFVAWCIGNPRDNFTFNLPISILDHSCIVNFPLEYDIRTVQRRVGTEWSYADICFY